MELCTIPDGTEVQFINHMATHEECVAYGLSIPDGVYTIKEEEGTFYAVKNVLAHLQEQLAEQESQEIITVRVKSLEYNGEEIMAKFLNHCAHNGLSLKDVAVTKTGKKIYDAICVNDGIPVGKFEFPFFKTWSNELKSELKKSIFEGKWELIRAETFNCGGFNKTFLLLSRKR